MRRNTRMMRMMMIGIEEGDKDVADCRDTSQGRGKGGRMWRREMVG